MICSRAFMLFRMLFLLRKELPGLKSIRSGQLFFFLIIKKMYRKPLADLFRKDIGTRSWTGRNGGRRS